MKSRLKSVWLLVAMETVKAACNFLKADSHNNDVMDEESWGFRISQFLSWPKRRVNEALANLRAAKEIDLEGIGKNKDIPRAGLEKLDSGISDKAALN